MKQYDSIYSDVNSMEVEELILFIDNTRQLATRRDEIYTKCKGNATKMGSELRSVEFLLTAKSAYKNEIGKSLKFDHAHEDEFVRHYISQYNNWLVDNPQADGMLSEDTDDVVVAVLAKCTIDGNVVRLPRYKLPDDIFKKAKQRKGSKI